MKHPKPNKDIERENELEELKRTLMSELNRLNLYEGALKRSRMDLHWLRIAVEQLTTINGKCAKYYTAPIK